MIPGKKYDPGTFTSRRPTPEKFEHLRKWIDVDEKFIDIRNITELKNINVQLEQSSSLFVSNVISRVIAQLLGAYGDGFVTLEATSDGKLKVETTIGAGTTVGLDAGSELIGKVESVAGSRTVEQAIITGDYSGDKEIIAKHLTKKIMLLNIFLVVSGAVSLAFRGGGADLTGIMELGDTDEPRGMVINFGDFPMEIAANKNFGINTTGTSDVMGFVNYYRE